VPTGESATRPQRYQPTQRDDEEALTRAMIELASQYGRYGYRRITVFLQRAGWRVGKDRVERISTPRTKTCPRGPVTRELPAPIREEVPTVEDL
jgi:transposase InsO family protein